MAELRDYIVANAVKVNVKDNKAYSYEEQGKVLTDYSGKDLLNEGRKYIIINGNVKPTDLSNFTISKSENEEVVYLYDVLTFEEYIMRHKNDLGMYAFQLLHRRDLTDREIKDAFKMFFESNKKTSEKKLTFLLK